MFKSDLLNALPKIEHGFYGRQGYLGTNTPWLPRQTHGDTIIRVDEKSDQPSIERLEADAIWTTAPNILIGIKTADCAPLLLADRFGLGVMAVHLGWRGAAIGLAQKAVRKFCSELGLSPIDLVAAIGPCIGFDSFVVKQDVVDALKKQVAPEGIIKKADDIHFVVDLAGWVERQLRMAGVEQIDKLGLCTVSDPERFFSFRRDQSAGRQMSVIMLR